MLVVQALKEGQNDAYTDTLVNEAATAGTITVPEILVTSDGRVDADIHRHPSHNRRRRGCTNRS